jgi:hypothetical protein
MTNQEILELVEWIAGGIEEEPKKQTNSDKLLMQIYRIVHSHREGKCCDQCHSDWQTEAERIYKENKKYF